MRIVYMGTPLFAATILEDILAHIQSENNSDAQASENASSVLETNPIPSTALKTSPDTLGEIIAVYTQPDRQAGRGKKVHIPETKEQALAHNIAVYQPLTFRNNPEAIEELRALRPDVLVVAAYGMLLPQEVLNIPTYGAYNVHASLLPKYRGAATVQRALIAGDMVTGVTIMRMEAGLDTGPILLQQCVPIRNDHIMCDNTESLLHTLAKDGAKLMITALKMIKDKRATFVAQNSELASHAPKLTKQEALINWDKSARQIHNHVRGFTPNPGATSTLYIDDKNPIQARIEQGFYLEKQENISSLTNIELAFRQKQENADFQIENGHIIGIYKDFLLVKTGKDYYGITKIRLAGKAQMDAKAFMNGYFKNNTLLYFK